MVIDEAHEATLIEALRHLTEAKSLIDMAIRDIGEEGGKRDRLIQDLTSIAVRVSSARKDGAKLIRRRPDSRLEDDPFRPPQPKWGGGQPPFQIDLSEAAEKARLAEQPEEPPESPPPPPEPLERS
jgi:hypothetical protein